MDFDLVSLLGFLPYSSHYHYESMKALTTNKQLFAIAEQVDGIHTAATFAGLTTCPELQSNHYRLEAIVHGFLALSSGKKRPTSDEIIKAFSSFEGTPVAIAEDPAEDVFVSLVSNSQGNFCTFEGLWENSAFFLQRFLDVLDSMPDSTWFGQLKHRVLALLKLSNELFSRCNLEKYSIGSQIPVDNIPNELLADISSLSNRVRFTEQEFTRLGIDSRDLVPFTCDLVNRDQLVQQGPCVTLLEKQPLVVSQGNCYIMLPSAISAAIRIFIVEEVAKHNMTPQLEKQLANSYTKHFHSIPLLGNLSRPPLYFTRSMTSNLFISSLVVHIDKGRSLHLIFLLDDFDNKEVGWLLGHSPNIKDVSDEITKIIKDANDFAKRKDDFKDGITLIVPCGWGRSFGFSIPEMGLENWKIEVLSAPDLTSMSLSTGFTALSLWRLLYARDKLSAAGGILYNVNGLLNLYGWSKELRHHLVPHEEIPSEDQARRFFIWVNQNSLLHVRQKAYQAWDFHVRVSPEGVPVRICRFHPSCYFEEDSLIPLYVSKDDLEQQQKLRAVYIGTGLELWCNITAPDNSDRSVVYHLFEAVIAWMHKLVSTFEIALTEIAREKLAWHLIFTSVEATEQSYVYPNYDKLKTLVKTSFDGSVTITTEFHVGFMKGFACETNIAERCMLWAFVKGVFAAYKKEKTEGEIESILDTIIPNEHAKSFHILSATTFLDYVAESLPKPITIEKSDDASLRIGLGWRARSRGEGSHILGTDNCTRYLGNVVDCVWEDVKELLALLNRKHLVERLIQNIEAARVEESRWNRTIRACLAQHNNKDDVLKAATEKRYSLHGAILGSRIAIEMALCECPLEEGMIPGEIEIARIIAYTSLIHYLGGWSDAIKFEAMHAEIKISHFGEVMIDPSFEKEVLYRFGNEMHKRFLESEAKEYSKLFLKHEASGRVEHLFESEFNASWLGEFGFSIDDCRAYIDYLEDLATERQTCVMKLRYSELLKYNDDTFNVSRAAVKAIIESLRLWPRSRWSIAPEGFSDRDWQPWKFRRRLSVASRPLIQLDNATDPTFLVAPGLIREGLVYVGRYSYDAIFDEKYFKSHRMQKWIGCKRNVAGHEFNNKVAEELRELKWEAKSNIKLTEALNKKLDKNYGDIDVLAWNKDSRRTLVIECKDLSLAKTHGEIARQLQEFRGRDNKKGQPDRLKKHLTRIKVLQSNIDAFAKYIGFKKTPNIETHLVFRNLVPIAFSTDDVFNDVQITPYDSLQSI